LGSRDYLKADAVFEGGGVKGIAFVGAICCLEEYGYEWQNIAGVSAGAIIGALLAAGYKGRELKDILEGLDYKKFLDRDRVQATPGIGKPLGLFLEKGFYNGSYIEEWIEGLLLAKGKTRFKDISINNESPLKIIASDITKKIIMILPDDLKNYGIDPMEFEISKAVRMSISLPFYFKPVKLEHKDGASLIVDGGILSNFPIWMFDVDGFPRWPTIGFKVVENEPSRTSIGKTDIVSYVFDIVNTILDRNEEIFLEDKDAVRTISIPSLGIKITHFDITKEESTRLFKEGYNCAKEFVRTWNFQGYIKKYRLKKQNIK
jgi:NTE family protein